MAENPSAATKPIPTKPATKAKPPVAKPAGKRPMAKTAPENFAPAKAAPAAQSAKATKTTKIAQTAKAASEKPKKPKLVRDSFTMPEDEYALIGQVKKACVAAGFEIKKSELLRIGVALIAKLDPKKLQAAQKALAPLKAGRPKKK